MAYDGVIIIREKGKLVPDTYAELVIKENPSYFGMAVKQNNNLVILRSSKDDPAMTLDEFKTIQQEYLDCTAVYIFNKSDLEIPDDCRQPYDVLVDTANQPTMAMFLEGDYSSFTQVKAVQTDDYFAANKFIIPTIKKLWTAQGMKLDKLINELNDPLNKQTLMNSASTRGTLTLVPDTFPPLSFDKNSGGSAFGWGWVSRTYGYVEEAPAAPAPKQGIVSRAVGRLGRSRPVTTAAPERVAEAEAVVMNKEGPHVPMSDIAAAEAENAEREAAENAEYEMIGPADDISGKKRKAFFVEWCDFTPADWYKKGVKAPANEKWQRQNSTLKSFKDLPRPPAEITVTEEHVPTPETGPKEPADAGPIVLSPATIKSIETLDRNSKLLPNDPKQFQALEAKEPNFFDQTGNKDDYLDFKPKEWFVALAKLDPYAIALIAFNVRNENMLLKGDVETLQENVTMLSEESTEQAPLHLAAPLQKRTAGRLGRRG